jgi:hypothetical protein
VPQRAYTKGLSGSVHGGVVAPQGFVGSSLGDRAGPKKGYTVFGGVVLGELQSGPASRVHHGAARPQAFSVEEIKVAHGERCGSAVIQDWLWRTRRKEQCRAINGRSSRTSMFFASLPSAWYPLQ